MKTIVTFKQNLLKTALLILVSAFTIVANAESLEPVPAKATAFTAIFNGNNKVELKWSTETEINLSHFMVERSTDGINFSNAALVFAYGNTTSKSDYAFADNISKLQAGVVYYRISSIGADGKSQYSDTRVIRAEK